MANKALRAGLVFGVVSAVGFTVSCSVAEAEPEGQGAGITLKVADWFPPEHPQSVGIQAWMEDVEALTEGQIEFSYFPAEQLGKAGDLLALTTAGTADIGSIGFGYNADALPLSGVGDLPGMHSGNGCSGVEAYQELLDDGGILDDEFRRRGIKALVVVTSSPYELLTNKRVETPADAAGLKLRSSGGVIQRVITALGAAPVNLSGPEQYEAIQRGTVDGSVFNYGVALTYSLQEVGKYVTDGAGLGSYSLAYSINRERWDELPEALQADLISAGKTASFAMCEANDADVQAFADAVVDSGGEIVTLNEAQKREFEQAMAVVTDSWVNDDMLDPDLARSAIADFRAAVASQ